MYGRRIVLGPLPATVGTTGVAWYYECCWWIVILLFLILLIFIVTLYYVYQRHKHQTKFENAMLKKIEEMKKK